MELAFTITFGILSTLAFAIGGWTLRGLAKVKSDSSDNKTAIAVIEAVATTRHDEYERRFTQQRKDHLDLRKEHIQSNRELATAMAELVEKMSTVQADIRVVRATCARVASPSGTGDC